MKKIIYKGMLSGGYVAKVILDFKATASCVEFPHDGEAYHIVTIGCAFADWTEVFDGIMHEMVELHMNNMELCYQRWYRAGCDSGDVCFHMNHAEYSEVISRSAQSMLCFIDKAKEEFEKYYRQKQEIKAGSPKRIKKNESQNDEVSPE